MPNELKYGTAGSANTGGGGGGGYSNGGGTDTDGASGGTGKVVICYQWQ